jgi:hypothetical protein
VNSSVDVLISYAREDRELAGSLAGLIECLGMTVWWDVQSIRAGQDFEALIRRALHNVKCVLVLWTATSVHPDRR